MPAILGDLFSAFFGEGPFLGDFERDFCFSGVSTPSAVPLRGLVEFGLPDATGDFLGDFDLSLRRVPPLDLVLRLSLVFPTSRLNSSSELSVTSMMGSSSVSVLASSSPLERGMAEPPCLGGRGVSSSTPLPLPRPLRDPREVLAPFFRLLEDLEPGVLCWFPVLGGQRWSISLEG